MQILAGIVLLGVLIAFHELGHFLFAKALGVRVLVFSIGFGPKIFGFTRGDTEYRLSAIPLGGYVRMFGESLEEELSTEEKKISFMHQAVWRKSLIAVAGPLFNFILPVILFFFLLMGKEQVLAPRIGTLVKDGAAFKAGLRADDLINSVNGQPVISFNDLADIIAKNPGVDLSLNVSRATPASKLDVVVRPDGKASANPLEKGQQVGRIGIMPALEKPVIMVGDESVWAKSGFKNLDEIKKVGNIDALGASDLMELLALTASGTNVEIERPSKDGMQKMILTTPKLPLSGEFQIDLQGTGALADKSLNMVRQELELWQKNGGLILANGFITELIDGSLAQKLGLKVKDRIVSIDGEKFLSLLQLQQIMSDTKNAHAIGVVREGNGLIREFFIPEDLVSKMDLNTDANKLFGLQIADVYKSGEIIERNVGPIEALKRAVSQTATIAVMTAKSLWMLVNRDVPASQIGGPIMLFDVAQQAAKKGLEFYIYIMCLLSVNLGLLNLLPIPALDGGHLLLFGIEAVQRKPLTPKTRAIATQIGIAILLTLMAFALFNDLSRLFR